MKRLSGSWAAAALLAPLTLMLALMLIPIGCGGGGGGAAATPTFTQGLVEVGLMDSPSSGFQQILLNVVAVRINPSGDLQLSDLDTNWRTLRLGSGAGGVGEVQVDLNNIQGQVQVFNTQSLAAQEYRQVELELDPNLPGLIVPNCPKAPAINEGCVSYQFQVANLATSPRANVRLQVAHKGLSPLVVDFNPGTITPPAAPGGFYTVSNPTISIMPFTQFLGEIHGIVSGVPSGGAASVKALQAGTDIVVARAPVISGAYVLELPAQDSGTAYDLSVAGPGVTYSSASSKMVTRGAQLTQDFTVGSAMVGLISGTITDHRSGGPIAGASIDLLLPPLGNGSADCKKDSSVCVVAASTTSDEAGHYPLPGTFLNPPAFDEVPLGTYTIGVKAAGFNPLLATAPVNTSGTAAICGTPNVSTVDCSFGLDSTTISGTVAVSTAPAPGADLQVLVMAEDAGTNTLENLTMTTIPSGATTASYTLIVPTTVAAFDLFASAQDFLNGRPSQFPGHQIQVLSNVVGGAAGNDFMPLDCVGHGSLTGEVAGTFDSATTVRLSKSNVQLMESQVGASSSANAGQFSFCAPPDGYTIQRYENGAPAGMPTAVTIPQPAPTSTPCPGICGLAGGTCPGVCNNTALNNPL